MAQKQEKQKTHAVVIGGGIAGLVASRVLLNHFEHITVIERDHYPKDPAFRPGVPQGRHVHSMQLRGQRELERLFPGLEKKLLAQGAVERDYGNQTHFFYGALCPKIPPVLHGWNCSRLLLEWQLRQELAAFPHLHLREGYEAVNVLFEPDEQRVSGVRVQARIRGNPMEQEAITADLVVDSSGAGSRTLQWLEPFGYPLPQETVINPYLGYATRIYERPRHFAAEWKGIAIQATREHRRGGVLMEIEGEQWMVVLAGAGKDYPPTEEAGFLAFARSLPDQTLFEAIKKAQPCSPIYGYRRTENRRRHLETMPRYPEGLILLGDALCTFNPIYGQGMTVAVLEALLLDDCLRRSNRRKGFARRFQRKAARVAAIPWQLATASDTRMVAGEQAVAARGPSRWLQQYMESLIALLPDDKQTFLTFLQVVHMVRSPLALFHPMMMKKVLAHMLRR